MEFFLVFVHFLLSIHYYSYMRKTENIEQTTGDETITTLIYQNLHNKQYYDNNGLVKNY